MSCFTNYPVIVAETYVDICVDLNVCCIDIKIIFDPSVRKSMLCLSHKLFYCSFQIRCTPFSSHIIKMNAVQEIFLNIHFSLGIKVKSFVRRDVKTSKMCIITDRGFLRHHSVTKTYGKTFCQHLRILHT